MKVFCRFVFTLLFELTYKIFFYKKVHQEVFSDPQTLRLWEVNTQHKNEQTSAND